ncbi:hypothetical protein BKA70DRAFT_1219413 [Coprinopsis sp. MPI-PUGE-AT-0042]|nr:hypothetical protein BKA70DRAFT_1219413 [Coprinopsis sp. MPI-PUGE-AT-0042]
MSLNTAPSIGEQNAVATMFAGSLFGASILSSVLYGIQLFMVLSNLSVFLKKSKEARKGHRHYIVISCLILVTYPIDTAFDIWQTFRILFSGGPEPWKFPFTLAKDADENRAYIFAGDTMFAVSFTVGDILMLWRCLILWDHKKWVVVLPCITFLGAIACNITYLVFTRPLNLITTIAVDLAVAQASLSVAMNLMVTLLILLRLAVTWRRTSKAFPDCKTPRMYTDAAGVLIEAAVPLSVLGIGYIITVSITTRDNAQSFLAQGRTAALNNILGGLYYSFCTLSPQMIIYRVANGRSWKDAAESQAGVANISQPINFAHTVEGDNDSDFSSRNNV